VEWVASPEYPHTTMNTYVCMATALTQGNVLTAAVGLSPASDLPQGRVGGGADGGVEQADEPDRQCNQRLRRDRRAKLVTSGAGCGAITVLDDVDERWVAGLICVGEGLL